MLAILFSTIQLVANEVRIDILVVSYSGVVIINYIDDVTLDYTELQDRLYNKS